MMRWTTHRSDDGSKRHPAAMFVLSAAGHSALQRSDRARFETVCSVASTAKSSFMPSTTASEPKTVINRLTDPDGSEGETGAGVLASQALRAAIADGWIATPGVYRMPDDAVQPASVDLHLGPVAWPLRCSFLPDTGSTVEEKMKDGIAFDGIDLRDGALLERNRPYLIPLIEELRLPKAVRARANPKSSTGRLDVFTRVITDRQNRFDEIIPGYRGKLYLEVVPRSFAIRVTTGLALNQLRLITGDARVSDPDIRRLHEKSPLLYADSHPLRASELALTDGLFLSLNVAGAPGTVVGYRAKQTSMPIDLSRVGAYSWQEYWDPVRTESGERIVLEPELFYLLMSAEGVSIPPEYAAEMLAYDPTAGELRTHYAGFFDPGFGYARSRKKRGSRVALEVRARDVAFMVEHGQPVCKLAFEPMAETPDVLYGEELGSHYQRQVSTLSKQFSEQTAGLSQMALPTGKDPREDPDALFKS